MRSRNSPTQTDLFRRKTIDPPGFQQETHYPSLSELYTEKRSFQYLGTYLGHSKAGKPLFQISKTEKLLVTRKTNHYDLGQTYRIEGIPAWLSTDMGCIGISRAQIEFVPQRKPPTWHDLCKAAERVYAEANKFEQEFF